MLLTVERPSGTRTAIRAWQSLFAGLGAMWPVFLGCAVLWIAWSFASPWLARQLPGSSDILTNGSGVWRMFGFMFFGALAHSLILAPVAVAMHRFILLGEAKPHPFAHPGVILHFTAWLVVLRLSSLLPAFSVLSPLPIRYGVILVILGVTVLMLWLTLLFPAIAVQDPAAGETARLETALERTAGNFWLLLRAIVIAFLPFFVLTLSIPLMLNYGVEAGIRDHGSTALNTIVRARPALTVLHSCIAALEAGLGAAVASLIYSYAITRTGVRQ